MYVRRRPFLDKLLAFLRENSGAFEVTIFTASVKAYADKLLDVLDPYAEVFTHRLYREHCTPLEACYTKDLRTLGRDMGSTVLVENTPLSYAFQPENSILVPTWTSDDADTELLLLVGLLSEMAGVADVRPLLRRRCEMESLVVLWHDFALREAAGFAGGEGDDEPMAAAAAMTPLRAAAAAGDEEDAVDVSDGGWAVLADAHDETTTPAAAAGGRRRRRRRGRRRRRLQAVTAPRRWRAPLPPAARRAGEDATPPTQPNGGSRQHGPASATSPPPPTVSRRSSGGVDTSSFQTSAVGATSPRLSQPPLQRSVAT